MKYIAEVDGLRAIAVLSVLIYHVNPEWLSGGFIGVDVFFVISGFLITGLLLKDIADGRLSLARFYVRRILRIAPALCVTLALTAVVFFALFPPVWTRDLLISLISAVLSFSNLWFYSTVDYFANNNASPVLHTWSLAVEEQFYFFFPLLLLIVSRKGGMRFKLPIFAVLFLVSLIASIAATKGPSQSPYFLPWLRAWELLCGSILASLSLASLPLLAKRLLSIGGVAMILAACCFYTDATPFPGYTALLPCLGAVAVIAGAGAGGPANRLLQLGAMRWVGKISYSLYLVHWPLICAASLTITLHSLTVKLAVIVASLGLAWLSWRYVETPFRKMAGHVSERRVFTIFGAACGALLLGFVALQFINKQFWNLHPTARDYAEFLRTDPVFFRPGTCFVTQAGDKLGSFHANNCLALNPKKPNVVLIGDSHAANIHQTLAEQFPNWQVLQATSPGCKPVVGSVGAPACMELMNYVFETWLAGEGKSVKQVILAAQWAEGDIEPLQRTVERLHRSGKQVIVYGPVPEHFIAVPLLLAFSEITHVDLRSHLFKWDRQVLDRKLKAALSNDATYFSPLDNICAGSECELVFLGAPVFFDRDHLTQSGARLAIKDFPLK